MKKFKSIIYLRRKKKKKTSKSMGSLPGGASASTCLNHSRNFMWVQESTLSDNNLLRKTEWFDIKHPQVIEDCNRTRNSTSIKRHIKVCSSYLHLYRLFKRHIIFVKKNLKKKKRRKKQQEEKGKRDGGKQKSL